VPSALWHVFVAVFMERRLKEHLGEDLFWAYTELINQAVIPLENVAREGRPWWFAGPEGHGRELAGTLEATVDRLRGMLGTDMTRWTWGRLHTLTMKHPMGELKVLAPFFNIGPFPSPGDSTTVNNGSTSTAPWRHQAGARTGRSAISDWDNSYVHGPVGQPRVAALPRPAELWRCGGTVPMAFSKETR
jgi:penicillin amidase